MRKTATIQRIVFSETSDRNCELAYPHIKNLTLEEIGTFKYIMDSPDTPGHIYVSQNINTTEFFNCTNIDFVKI